MQLLAGTFVLALFVGLLLIARSAWLEAQPRIRWALAGGASPVGSRSTGVRTRQAAHRGQTNLPLRAAA